MKAMPVDLQRLQDDNQKSLDAVNNSIARLMDLSDDGLPLSQASAVNTQLIRAQADKVHLQIVRAHLGAAGVIVEPMDADTADRLDELSEKLDAAILDDFVINAGLDFIRTILDAAEEISTITLKNS
jgi:hypothetical protein